MQEVKILLRYPGRKCLWSYSNKDEFLCLLKVIWEIFLCAYGLQNLLYTNKAGSSLCSLVVVQEEFSFILFLSKTHFSFSHNFYMLFYWNMFCNYTRLSEAACMNLQTPSFTFPLFLSLFKKMHNYFFWEDLK